MLARALFARMVHLLAAVRRRPLPLLRSSTMARVEDVAAYLLEQCGTVTTYKLHKLLYYAQGWSLAWDGEPLFDAKIKAYENGPVVSALFHEHRGQRHVSRWPDGDPNRLTEEQRETILAVVERYGRRSPEELVDSTYREGPWLEAWSGDRTTAREITLSALREFFLTERDRARAASPEAVALAGRMRKSFDDG